MVLIPFLYFAALTAYWWKQHHGIDVCVYMSGLYAFISFCAVAIVGGDLLDAGGILFDEYNIELGLIPTILFCALITLGIFPFSLIFNKEIKQIKKTNSLILDCFCWFLFFVFIINLYLIVDSTLEILSGDLSSVRMDHYEGIQSPAEVKAESMPRIFGYFFYFNISTLLALPLFFYYVCCGSKPWWFKAMLIATSLSYPLYGMQAADRTEFTFYVMMLIFCLVFFWNLLSKKFKRNMAIIGTPFVLIIIIYLVAVSQARFAGKDDDNEKVSEAALQYAGQGYLNFCYFWENGKFEHISAEREFPFTYHTLFKIDSNPERRADRSGQQGFFISVFATYVGDILIDLSPIGAILWCLIFFIICMATIRFNHKEEYDAGDILALFVLAAIPIFGIFYYRYHGFNSFFLFVPTVMIYFFSKNIIVYEPTRPEIDHNSPEIENI